MLAVEMLNELTDMLGLTGAAETATQNRLYRAINRGKDRVVAAYKWPWLETSTQQLFTSGTRVYNLTTHARAVVSIHGSTGFPVRKVERDTFDELHDVSTVTAPSPSVYREQGHSNAGAIEVKVWPTPSANSTGTLRYIANVADTTGSNSWDRVPSSHHKAILTAAEVELHRQEGKESEAAMAEARYRDEVDRLVGRTAGPVIRDGSEQ